MCYELIDGGLGGGGGGGGGSPYTRMERLTILGSSDTAWKIASHSSAVHSSTSNGRAAKQI